MVEKVVWKEIEGFEGKYSVSNCGRVWNNKDNLEVAQVVTGIPQYKYVNLQPYEGKRKLVRVHRLVAKAFLEWDKKYNVVDHIDRDKFNNHVSNLRWTDRSGNMKNKENSVYIDDMHILDYVNRYGEKKDSAYNYILTKVREGMTVTDALNSCEEWLVYQRQTEKVVWDNNEVYLLDLCRKYDIEYYDVLNKLRSGWDLWNAVYKIPPATEYTRSLEVPTKSAGLSYWFPNKQYLMGDVGYGKALISKFIAEGYTLEDMIEHDPLERHRQTIKGVTGTVPELCKHFGVTESALDTRRRKGMSLEEALTMKPLRIKYAVIDGTKKTLKGWYEHFGLEYSKAKAYKDKTECQFHDVLTYFGIDISNLNISY